MVVFLDLVVWILSSFGSYYQLISVTVTSSSLDAARIFIIDLTLECVSLFPFITLLISIYSKLESPSEMFKLHH